MTVLILADDLDPSADQMVYALADREVAVCRMNTAWFPAQLTVDAELRGDRWTGQLRTPHRSVELEDIHAVWMRVPATFRFPAEWSRTERQHSFNEAKFGLGGVLVSTPALWINHPHRLASMYKPAQLATAVRCGLSTPATLITNDAGAVRRFAADMEDGTVLTKMLGAPAITEQGVRKVGFTRRVSRADLDDLAGVQWTAHQFQHWVPKAFDCRIIVVGQRQFAVAIHAGNAAARLDFRRDYKALRYEPIPIPASIAEGVRVFMNSFGLVYGAFDFAVTPDDQWWFLECNPGGQYGWLEAHTGLPITTTLADALARGAIT